MADADSEIIRELRTGNQIVFEQVFKQYYALLCAEARDYFKQNYLIEEIVCDVFTRLWLNRLTLEIRSSLRNYLIKSVHNNCINYYRTLKVQEKLKNEIGIDQQETYASLIDIGENPLDYMITYEMETSIVSAIESLPTQYRKAFTLSRFNNMTYDEIAVEMGISVNSVKTNIKNALTCLKKKLSDYLPFITLIF